MLLPSFSSDLLDACSGGGVSGSLYFLIQFFSEDILGPLQVEFREGYLSFMGLLWRFLRENLRGAGVRRLTVDPSIWYCLYSCWLSTTSSSTSELPKGHYYLFYLLIYFFGCIGSSLLGTCTLIPYLFLLLPNGFITVLHVGT